MAEVKPRILNGGRGSGQTVRRITEIYEEKIADIKANCDLAIEGRDLKIMELEKGCEETQELLDKQIEATYKLDKKNAELKKRLAFARAEFQRQYKENAELKSELTKKADTNHSLVEQMAKMESDFRTCEKNADTYYDHLIKAKELLQRFIKWARTENCEKFDVILADTEQFLKEIEK